MTGRESQSQDGKLHLMGVAEVAEMFGVSRQRGAQITQLPEFPRPVAELRATRVWLAQDVSQFALTWERKAGRPWKKEKET